MIGLYDAVRARLQQLTELTLVDVAHSPAAAEVFAFGEGPAALVCPLVETASPIKDAAMIASQKVTERFGVILCLTYPLSFPHFEPAREAIKATLRGWAPTPDASEPVAFVGGRTLVYDISQDGGAWRYLLEFSVPSQDRVEHQP